MFWRIRDAASPNLSSWGLAFDGLDSKVIDKPIPVAEVSPRPNLDNPLTPKLAYAGLSTCITGFTYPVPIPIILNVNSPPSPDCDLPTFKVNVLIVVVPIEIDLLLAGSVKRGYECSEE